MEPIRVLYVEDSEADQELTRQLLALRAPHLKLRMAPSLADALDQLTSEETDLVLCAYRLPDGSGLDLLDAVRARALPVPVVLVTGSGDPEAAIRLLKAGATDYVLKRSGYLETLPAVIEGAFRWFQSVRELRRTAIRVLYAEHELADVELTRRAFRQYGPHFELDVVSRGQEALKCLRGDSYDLLLLDYRLPDLSAIEVLKLLREERIRIPVVMVTGQGDEKTAVQAFKLGAADYLIKHESEFPKLATTLENVVAQRRLAEEKDALLVLNGLTRSIARLRDVNEVAQALAASARDLLKGEASVLWLYRNGEFVPASWRGLENEEAGALRWPADEARLLRASGDRRLALSESLAGRPLPAAAALFGDPDRTLAVSLAVGDRVTGVIAVMSARRGAFASADERLLTILADHAAIAIHNLQLYDQLGERLEELHRMQARLVQTEKIAAMGQLLAGVAHELNNPLSVVLGRATLLSSQVADGPLARQASQIAEAAERCARIVRNFLALARQRPQEREVVRLDLVVRGVIELLNYQLRVADIQVHVESTPDLPPLWADPHELHQVVVNLVSNAYHAMRQAPPPRRLTLTTESDAARGMVVLRIEDTGPGIPPALHTQIFEPFFTTKAPGEGTGLGLSICQSIAEGHGGSIRMERRRERGAAFVVELPVQVPARPQSSAEADRPALPPGAKRILVVDDEPAVAATLAELLTADGHQVDTAANGRLALAKIRAGTYDLIMSDLRMPELDGPGLYQELERHHPELRTRLVFLTGDTLDSTITEFLQQSGTLSMSKPFTWHDLRRIVDRALSA